MLATPADRQDWPVHDPKPPMLLDLLATLPAAQPLLARLDRDGPGIHVVGGAVRDLLLGGRPTDLDLVVEGDPATVIAALGGEIRAYDRFGTATVTADGFTYDVARARRETYAHPGALPDVAPASLEEDLRRRDFTVNAIAVALTGPGAGELQAVAHALEDLDARRLRILHDRSFIDDPTRMLRLIRYATRLGFAIEPHTRALLDPAALATVSGARVGAELRLLAREPDPVAALAGLRTARLDQAIHPGFGLREQALTRRALALLPPDGRPGRLVLAAAGRRLPRPELARLLEHLAFEAADRDAIVAAAGQSEALARSLSAAAKPSEIAAAAGDAGPELVALAGALGPSRQAREWLQKLRHVKLELDGRDLLAAGVPQGPSIGRALRAALAAKLDGRASGREAELAEALEAVSSTG